MTVDKSSIVSVSEKIFKFSALVGFFSFSIAIVYEVVFFEIIGSDILKLFTLSDYVENSLSWLPMMTFISFVTMYSMNKISEINKHFEKNLQSTDYKVSILYRIEKFIRRASWYFIFLAFFMGALFIPQHNPTGIMLIGLIALVGVGYLISKSQILLGLENFVGARYFNLIPYAYIFIFGVCVTSAQSAYRLLDKDEGTLFSAFVPDEKVELLRSIDKGLVVFRPKSQIITLYTNNGKGIVSFPIEKLSYKSRYCLWIGIGCEGHLNSPP